VDGAGVPLENLADENAVGAAIGPAAPANPSNASIQFEIPTVINMASATGGTIPGDDTIPGLPATNGSTDGNSVEILTYLNLPVGLITMGVQSDDSFGVQAGPNPKDAFGRVELKAGEGGAQPQTLFSFQVTAAGIYPFRTLWQNGGGGVHIEWFSKVVSGGATNNVLINDVANGGIPAYRALSNSFPFVKGVTPAAVPRQTERSSRSVNLLLANGTTPVKFGSVNLKIDGATVPVNTNSLGGGLLSVDSGVLDGFKLSAETHTAVLSYSDTGSYSRTQAWTFQNLQNLILPANPVTGENFNSYPEATSRATTVPPGWVATNYTYLETAGWDLADVTSDSYLDWVLITTDTVTVIARDTLDNDKGQTINGQPVTNFMSGNLLHAPSDGRLRRVQIGGVNQNDYAPQIQIAVSAPFNLSSVTNPVLTFSSGVRISGNHEQDALEYSVDNGTNWLPALIMQNAATVFLNPDGSYDAVKMLTNVWADVAKFPVVQDPATRDFVSSGPLGQKFGDVLKVPITPALSPYVANRNDGVASRKVEAIRLPEASKKSQVRLRFTHYGSCGWDWGIDNIAFYDIAPATGGGAQPHIERITTSNNQVTIQWSGGGTLESSPSLGTPAWTSTGNSSGSFTENLSASGNKYYRVRQ
jgi:hypothetical protein